MDVIQITNYLKSGLFTEEEALDRLETLQIRGAFNGKDHFFIGYDYNNQQWIEIPR